VHVPPPFEYGFVEKEEVRCDHFLVLLAPFFFLQRVSGFNFQGCMGYISSCSSTSYTQKQALPVQIMEERMGKNRKEKVHNKE